MNAREQPATEVQAPADSSLPGEVGVWVFVLGDMSVFALFFTVFLLYRGQAPELFLASQQTLDVNLGVINTLLLLSSSWFVAQGVSRARTQARGAAALFGAAAACGIAFVGIKVHEYAAQAGAGHLLTSNDFYMFYYVLTGIHLGHVLIGLGVLAFLAVHVRRGKPNRMLVESGGVYWHMVDLLWIVLFPLIFLVH